jgi:hypothetical protein
MVTNSVFLVVVYLDMSMLNANVTPSGRHCTVSCHACHGGCFTKAGCCVAGRLCFRVYGIMWKGLGHTG